MAAKNKDKRIDAFRDEATSFVTDHLSEMTKVFDAYMKEKNYDKAVSLYMKLADKVIPALATQMAETTNGDEKPAWMAKVEKAKKTIENDTK